ncbi:MAG: DUF423 domain-containing protein [Bacteriovoracaceae bacterium]
MKGKSVIVLGAVLLALGVIIGAFGAHGLEKIVAAEKLATFETGVRYHFYHALALLMTGIIALIKPEFNARIPANFFLVGILLFSFNCYLYVVTGIKTFAMIVPVGGFCFIFGWVALALKARKLS